LPEGERKLAAIMFTDMVGYTALGQKNESLSLALVEEQRKQIRPILKRHNGREVKTIGDAFLVEFPNAIDAVRCGYDIQRTVREFNLSLAPESRIHLRIGVHLGEVVESSGDISGDAVNVAARIEPLAKDGGVCISRQVYDHVQNKFELPLTSLGAKSLKNVSTPIEVYEMVMPWSRQEPAEPTELDKRRIAVLPFSNMSQDPNDEYFAEGMTEELITTLSGIRDLTVIARTSVLKYKSVPRGVSEIGQELNVGTLIEGSVRKAGNRVRITVQMIDSRTEGHAWAQNYDRQLEDIFAVQSEIAEKVAGSLKIKLLEKEKTELEAGSTRSADAHDKYLLAMHANLDEGNGLARIRYLEESIQSDPNFALAHSALGQTYVLLAGDYLPAKEAFSKARTYISKALELDDRLAEAWTAHGNLSLQQEWNWEEAERSFKKAIELNPSSPGAYSWYSTMSAMQGRYQQAVQLAKRATDLNPLPLFPRGVLCAFYALAGDHDGAIRESVKLRELHPTDAEVHNILALAYSQMGNISDARNELDLLEEEMKARRARGTRGWTTGVVPWIYATNAFTYAASGGTDQVRKMIGLAEGEMKEGYVSPAALGTLYLASGDETKAFELFEKELDEGSPGLLFHAMWKGFDPVRSDPRFVSLLKRMGTSAANIR
jgi:TolB-like protein/Flp pilus assembly protein TadD